MSIKDIFPIHDWDFKSQSIMHDLPAADIDLLCRHAIEKKYKKGEVVFKEGIFPSGIFYIIEGKIKKYKVDKEGKEHIIYIANTGELIGYHAVLAEENYPDSAATLEASRIMFIPKGDLLLTLNQSAVLNQRLLKTLSHEFNVLANSLTVFAKKTVRQRLALQLIIIREKYKLPLEPGKHVEINISRDDLANMVGTARENVVRVLTEFKEDGILETKGRLIIVHDINKLVAIADYI